MQVYSDLDSLSRSAAMRFSVLCAESIAARGKFNVALSGGSTPKRMFADLASGVGSPIDWANVHVFWGDERYVVPLDVQSSEGMARLVLLDHVPIIQSHVYPMYQEGGVEAAAAAYEALVQQKLGPELALDLLMLGLGPDGHTASLFPGEPAVHITDRLVVAGLGHAGIAERITMTPPLLNRARVVMFLVAGADKAEPLQRVLHGPEDWDATPAQAVARHAANVEWFVDQEALRR